MYIKRAKWAGIFITVVIIFQVISPVIAASTAQSLDGDSVPKDIAEQVSAVIPLSADMVDSAVAALSSGLSGLTSDQKAAFLRIYDPSGTGDVDEEFLDKVVKNYGKIYRSFEGEIAIVYEDDSSTCEGKRLFYTDMIKIHVCPYFKGEDNVNRVARVLIHEMAHKALMVTDRHYFRTTSKAYLTLTPNGSWTAQIPLVGKIFRELAHSDTLYHPDAYAHFALAVYTGDYEAVIGG